MPLEATVSIDSNASAAGLVTLQMCYFHGLQFESSCCVCTDVVNELTALLQLCLQVWSSQNEHERPERRICMSNCCSTGQVCLPAQRTKVAKAQLAASFVPYTVPVNGNLTLVDCAQAEGAELA